MTQTVFHGADGSDGVGTVLTVRQSLRNDGWAVLRDMPFHHDGLPIERAVLDLASAFGVPSARDGGRAVWPVTPSTDTPGSTFSVRAGEARFHTDAQYHDEPEDLVCLFCVRPAADGGVTRLLGSAAAAVAVRRQPDGPELLRMLAAPIWRWSRPATFASADALMSPRPAFTDDGRIRWRGDNLDPSLPEWQREAAARIDACLLDASGVAEIQLDVGDVVIVDNHRMLHARTWFADPHRFLLRVRLWRTR